MGAIARATHRSGRQVWQARWRDPAGRQRGKNFDRKVDAEQYLLAMETDKLRGRYTDPAWPGRLWPTGWPNTWRRG